MPPAKLLLTWVSPSSLIMLPVPHSISNSGKRFWMVAWLQGGDSHRRAPWHRHWAYHAP